MLRFKVTAMNLRFLDPIGFWAVRHGFSLPGQAQRFIDNTHLRDLLNGLQIDCVIDVGANKGQHAQKLRRIGYKGRIVSFEPMPADFEVLRRVAASDPLWEVHDVALGRRSETKAFNVITDRSGGTSYSSFLSPTVNDEIRDMETINVAVRRLDDVLANETGRLFPKVDTQGFDVEVLRGAGGILNRLLVLQSETPV